MPPKRQAKAAPLAGLEGGASSRLDPEAEIKLDDYGLEAELDEEAPSTSSQPTVAAPSLPPTCKPKPSRRPPSVTKDLDSLRSQASQMNLWVEMNTTLLETIADIHEIGAKIGEMKRNMSEKKAKVVELEKKSADLDQIMEAPWQTASLYFAGRRGGSNVAVCDFLKSEPIHQLMRLSTSKKANDEKRDALKKERAQMAVALAAEELALKEVEEKAGKLKEEVKRLEREKVGTGGKTVGLMVNEPCFGLADSPANIVMKTMKRLSDGEPLAKRVKNDDTKILPTTSTSQPPEARESVIASNILPKDNKHTPN